MTQPRGLLSPPIIAPEKPLRPTASPMKSDAWAIGARRNPERPASAELTTKAPTMMALVLMPIKLATLPLAATARIAFPTMVRFITQSKTSMMATATASISISCGRTPIPRIRMTESPTGPGTTTGLGPQMARPMLCRMTPNPSVLITHAMPGRPANGRTPTR
ncbi:hypothetical protein D3C71_1740770 [compost metagenome]